MDEAAIVQSARNGDAEAFGLLVDRYADRVFNLLVRSVGPHDAEDLAQETFMKAYANIAKFSGSSAFYTWLFSIALNTARSFHRKKRPVTVSQDNGEANPFDRLVSDNPGPRVVAEKEEKIHRVQSALMDLAEEDREVILLREVEGLAYDEIAQTLETTTAAVRSRLHRARHRLLDALRDEAE